MLQLSGNAMTAAALLPQPDAGCMWKVVIFLSMIKSTLSAPFTSYRMHLFADLNTTRSSEELLQVACVPVSIVLPTRGIGNV